jgi:hypothetical protein
MLWHKIIGAGGVGGDALTLTYIGTADTGENVRNTSNPVNFGSFNAASDGLMIVASATGNGSNAGVTSCTIGGASATEAANSINVAYRRTSSGIFTREVTAGNQEVIATLNRAPRSAAVFVYLLTGYTSATPTDTDADSKGSSGTSMSMTLDIPGPGVALYVVATRDDASGYSWSSATEDGEFLNGNDSGTYGGAAASKTTGTLLTAHVETATYANDDERTMAAAAWS